MSKLNGITKAAELLQKYIDEQDAKLATKTDYFDRGMIASRKIGAIEFFERITGASLKDTHQALVDMKKQINKPLHRIAK